MHIGQFDGVSIKKNEDVDTKEKEHENRNDPKGIGRDELIEQLESHVNYFDSLPQHEKFSFALNVDLQYFMTIILNILKKG